VFAFVAYAVLTWYLTFRFRRQWRGVLVLIGSMLGLALVTVFHFQLNKWTRGAIYLPVLQVLLYSFAALTLSVGLFIVAAPRRERSTCRTCQYNLAGLYDEGMYVCPECATQHVYLRGDAAKCPVCKLKIKLLHQHEKYECERCHTTIVCDALWAPSATARRALDSTATAPEAAPGVARPPEPPRAAEIAPAMIARVQQVAAELRSPDYEPRPRERISRDISSSGETDAAPSSRHNHTQDREHEPRTSLPAQPQV
jgi:predicted RNA-binding Zn-ribbon protein involved in translation (DUF1610 family)